MLHRLRVAAMEWYVGDKDQLLPSEAPSDRGWSLRARPERAAWRAAPRRSLMRVAVVRGTARAIGAATERGLARHGEGATAVDMCADDTGIPYGLAIRSVVCEGSSAVTGAVLKTDGGFPV